MKLFGYTFFERDKEDEELKSITKDPQDGSLVLTTTNKGNGDNGTFGEEGGSFSSFTTTFDVDALSSNENQLITKYREISLIPEVEKAINIIVDEMISSTKNDLVDIDLDELEYGESLKKKIKEEFDYIVNIMGFNSSAFEILRRWYIDGRYQYQVVVNQETYKEKGIGKLVYLDPRKIKKVKTYVKSKDQNTGADVYSDGENFYIYSDNINLNDTSADSFVNGINTETIRLSEESVVQVTSGLLNSTGTVTLSWLHKSLRPLNQLRGLEDSAIIFQMTRAIDRKAFYIDVGGLSPAKAEQAVKRQMMQYKAKPVYDAATGNVVTNSKNMTMYEDYWFPRRSDGKATEIVPIPGGTNPATQEVINYFLNKLYNALGIPVTRMEPSTGFSMGRSTEISRDEVMLMKFVNRLRRRFANIFLDLLRTQLALKNIMHPDEFDRIREFISIEFQSDNHFDELLENEVLEGRLNLLDRMHQYMGIYWSREEIMRDILKKSEEDIKQTDKLIASERSSGVYDEITGMGEGGVEPPKITRVMHTTDSGSPLKTSKKTLNNTESGTTIKKESE